MASDPEGLLAAAGVAKAVVFLARPAIPRERLLEDETRASIARIAAAEPGLSTGRLRRRLSLTWGTFTYHLEKLSSAGLVSLTHRGRRTYVGAPGTAEARDAIAEALSSQAARRIARAILASPGSSILDLERATSISRRMTYYHVRQLLDTGLVTTTSRTRHHDLRGTPDLAVGLADYID